MFGFLLKVGIVAAVVSASAIYLLKGRPSLSLSSLPSIPSNLISWNQISSALDSLVTHSDKSSPVVLGIKITSDSLNTLVDAIQGLPPEQVDQIKQVICAPATASAIIP